MKSDPGQEFELEVSLGVQFALHVVLEDQFGESGVGVVRRIDVSEEDQQVQGHAVSVRRGANVRRGKLMRKIALLSSHFVA